MHEEKTTRRRFLVAAVTFSGVGATLGSSWLKSATAWAEGTDLETLGQLAATLFPHDGLDMAVYGEIMSDVLDSAVTDQATADLLDTAIALLDQARDYPWLDLDADDQLAVMKDLQDEPFFAGIREMVRFNLYYHPRLWEHINYPGSSKEYGGYIRRGFNDIAWLPEGD